MRRLIVFLFLAGLASAKEYRLLPPHIPAPKIVEAIPPPQTHVFAALDVNNAFTGNNTHSGTETFTGRINCKNFENARCVDNANNQGWAGANVAAWIDSAGADCGGSTCTVVISSDAADGNPATPLANVLYIDYRPKGTGDGPNEVAFNVWDGTAINNQAGSTGSYDRALLTCGRVIPGTANKSFGCIRAYMYLPGSVMGSGPGATTTGSLVFTQSNTDTITNTAFAAALEPEIAFNGTGLSIYDIRGATINNILGVTSPVGTVGSVKLFDTQPSGTIPSTLHIQKWIGYNAENPAVPAVSLTATGTVNCNGTSTVTWVSGDKFTDGGMLGYPIVIAGTTYTVATVTSPPGTTLTVNSATGGATTCPNASGAAYTFAGNQYSMVMSGNIWLRGNQSPVTPTDSNGSGGIMLDTGIIGTGQLARSSIAIRDTAALRNADGTFKRTYIDENNGTLEIKNQAFTQNLLSIDSLGNTAIFGNTSLAQNGAAFLPNAAGANDLGSASLPFGNLWLGNAATNNIQLTGTATTAKVATLPNNTGTIAELNLAQTWTAAQTHTGAAIIPDQTSGITGTTTNNNANAGAIGEYVQSVLATGSSVTLATGVTSNVTSISLTAGDWDVTGAVDFTFGATTSYTNLIGSVSTTTGTIGGQDSKFDFETPAAVPTAGADATFPVPVVRFSLSGTTTVFLVAQGTFTVSTLKAYGTIRARRVR